MKITLAGGWGSVCLCAVEVAVCVLGDVSRFWTDLHAELTGRPAAGHQGHPEDACSRCRIPDQTLLVSSGRAHPLLSSSPAILSYVAASF